MNRRQMLAGLVLVAAFFAPRAEAQSLRYLRRIGGYGAVGFGGGNFKLTCDSGCVGNQLGSSGATLTLGRHISQRVRAELGFGFQSNRDEASDLFSASLGAAVYLVGGLHVRGGATYQRASVEDTTGSYTGSGGPGFMVGAGYDLHIGRTWALTPYARYMAGSISKITRSQLGGVSSGTSGSVRALNFGVSISRIMGRFECTTRGGSVIPLTYRNRASFEGCLNEVRQRYGNTNMK